MGEYIIDMGNSSYKSSNGLLCADVSQLREEIVRCRDCKHYEAWMQGAKLECWANGEPFSVEPSGFCAWGERRDA